MSHEEGKNWAEQRGFIFLETSAKSSSGVETAFYQLVDKILQEPALWEKELGRMGQQEMVQRQGVRIEFGEGRGEGSGRGCCN